MLNEHVYENITVSEFELQPCYYIHFQIDNLGKGMNCFILKTMG